MIIIGSGSRDWKDYKPIAKVMRGVINRYGLDFMYYHGAQRGFDQISAYQLNLLKHRTHTPFPYIRELGKAGGMVRNRHMLAEALLYDTNILLIAMPLPQSIGTFGMISICKAAKIQIEIYNADGELT